MYELAREFLIINGQGFHHVCQGDLKITVANITCDMTKVSPNQLVCQLPSSKMKTQRTESKLAIEVILGSKFEGVGLLTFPVAREGRTFQDVFLNESSLAVYISATVILSLGLLFMVRFIILKNKNSRTKAVGHLQDSSLTSQKRPKLDLLKEGGQERHRAATLLRQCDELMAFLDCQDGELSTKVNLAFPRNKLTALDESEKLGSGFAGCVYRATATGLFPNKEGEQTTVAVKTVRDADDAFTLKALRTELKILAELEPHPHVLKLLAACTDNLRKEKLLLLLEYCPLGSLKNFLTNNKGSFVRVKDTQPFLTANPNDSSDYEIPFRLERFYYNSCCSPYGKEFCSRDLLLWAGQIASGMEHLEMHKVLHGDLAARNILLSSERQVKIADFGLARDMYCTGLYKKTGKEPTPFKWMAPESLKTGQFSSQSDVWSFGVLLWEMFSLGNEPYPGCWRGDEVLKDLENGHRLSKPEHASDDVYKLTRQCWSLIPEDRSTFTQLKEKLAIMVEGQDEWDSYIR